MTDQMNDQNDSVLAPPQPADPPGARPPVNWPDVVGKVQAIQKNLADERAERAEKAEKTAKTKEAS